MMNRLAITAAVCTLTPTAVAPLANAEPAPPPPAVPVADAAPPPPPPPGGLLAPMPSAPPGVLNTPDGWTLTVFGKDESMAPVPPLIGVGTSREYLVDGTFTGTVTGNNVGSLTGGTLEAGYQIGCGILQDSIEPIVSAGITPGLAIPIVSGTILPVTFGAVAGINTKIALKPGTVNIIPVGKKSFKGTVPRISITGLRVKFDSCAGQSFIRSYATLTAGTANTDDVITYMGVTKVV